MAKKDSNLGLARYLRRDRAERCEMSTKERGRKNLRRATRVPGVVAGYRLMAGVLHHASEDRLRRDLRRNQGA